MEDKNQTIPLAPPISDEESTAQIPLRHRLRHRRRCALWCCGICGSTLVVLGVTILILALTVFKIKDPEMTLNNLYINRLFVPGVGTLDNPTVSVNATLTADLSIKNPNVASFRFRNSSTEFFYGEETVGVAYAPDGNVRAYRTARMNVTVDVLADRVVLDTNATGSAVFDGAVNMSSYTDIAGRVNVIGVYKLNMDIHLNCSFTLEVYQRAISNKEVYRLRALLLRFLRGCSTSVPSWLFDFGSFVAVRLRSFDDFPFWSDRKLRHFDRKQEQELAGCKVNFLPFARF